jgi:hypothetical protein
VQLCFTALTASAMTAMWLWELPSTAVEEDASPTSVDGSYVEHVLIAQRLADLPLLGVPTPEMEVVRQKEPVVVESEG